MKDTIDPRRRFFHKSTLLALASALLIAACSVTLRVGDEGEAEAVAEGLPECVTEIVLIIRQGEENEVIRLPLDGGKGSITFRTDIDFEGDVEMLVRASRVADDCPVPQDTAFVFVGELEAVGDREYKLPLTRSLGQVVSLTVRSAGAAALSSSERKCWEEVRGTIAEILASLGWFGDLQGVPIEIVMDGRPGAPYARTLPNFDRDPRGVTIYLSGQWCRDCLAGLPRAKRALAHELDHARRHSEGGGSIREAYREWFRTQSALPGGIPEERAELEARLRMLRLKLEEERRAYEDFENYLESLGIPESELADNADGLKAEIEDIENQIADVEAQLKGM